MAKQKAASQAGQEPFLIVFKQGLDLLISIRSHFLCLLEASKGKDGREGTVEEQTQGLGKVQAQPWQQGQDGFVFLQL